MYRLTIILLVLGLFLQGCLLGSFSKAQLLFYSSVSDYEFKVWAASLKNVSIYQTIKNYHQWGYDHLTWDEDSWNGYLDYPRDPLIMLKRLRGDCDDYANLFANGLLETGIDAVTLAVAYNKDNGDETGHSVCLIQSGEVYYHIGNWELVYDNGSYSGVFGPYKTIEEAAISVGKKTTRWYFIRDPKNLSRSEKKYIK